jgi:hypothetical protein
VGRRQTKKKPTYKPKKPKVERSEPSLLVFISSVMGAMKKERDTLYHTIHSIQIARPWLFEYSPASFQDSVETYLKKVQECDIFVLLLGADYSEPVVREYETAAENGKRILVFTHTAEKDENQKAFIELLRPKYKYNSFTTPQDLHDVVYNSVVDEIIRTFRSAVRPTDTARIIEQMPMTTSALNSMDGFLIVGVDENQELMQTIFKGFGATTPPHDLSQINPLFEPIYFKNIAELNEASGIVRKANERAQAAPADKQKVFFRELKRESLDVLSKRIIRQHANEPEPEVPTPGISYFIWGQDPDSARLYRLIHFEDPLKESIPVQRIPSELLFKTAKRFLKVSEALQRSKERAQGDNRELIRLLGVEAGMINDNE